MEGVVASCVAGDRSCPNSLDVVCDSGAVLAVAVADCCRGCFWIEWRVTELGTNLWHVGESKWSARINSSWLCKSSCIVRVDDRLVLQSLRSCFFASLKYIQSYHLLQTWQRQIRITSALVLASTFPNTPALTSNTSAMKPPSVRVE